MEEVDQSFTSNLNKKIRTINNENEDYMEDKKDTILVPLDSERKNPSKELF